MAETLGTFEQAVLLAILRLKEDAYGAARNKEVDPFACGCRDADSRWQSPAVLPSGTPRHRGPERGSRNKPEPLARSQMAVEGIYMADKMKHPNNSVKPPTMGRGDVAYVFAGR